MFSEKRYVHWTLSTANQDVVKQKDQDKWDLILLSVSCPLCFIQYLFCSLWKFLLKIAKNKVLCKDVRFFETWNALINRLDEINLKVLYSLNSENYQRKLLTRQLFLSKWKSLLSRKSIVSSHASIDILTPSLEYM